MLFSAASAQAATVTVGSPLTQSFKPEDFGSLGMAANSTLPEIGAMVDSPTSGTVVRWRVIDASGGPLRLRILEPAGGTAAKAVGTSASETPGAMTTQTFETSLPIKAGDTIAIEDTVGTETLGIALGVHGAGFIFWSPPIAEGSTESGSALPETELGFNADVQPPPGITGISATSGSIKGGTSVVITGHDFTGASGVKFGSLPATSFTVNSETQVTAVAPPGAAPGAVDTSVTTAAGTTPASTPDQFTYTACVVPKLKGKKLKAAGKVLKKAECKLGKVKGKKSKKAKVKAQSPKAGSVLAPGSKVSVKVK
ncbi:MAG: IPT/TIG domain-containing protein [Solirubrobacterales bacterium]